MSRTWTFHGGIHPAENKRQSLRSAIAQAGIPHELVLPLSQHIGAPAQPIVAVGDHVLKGQMIAEPRGLVSVPVHAPTSGTVKAIEQRVIAHPSGYGATCIVITTDGQDRWIAHDGDGDYRRLDRPTLLARIRAAGIAGMGGAGFPSAVKLSPPPGTEIDTLIINGTECEPYITADDVLMRERASEVIDGTQILQHLVQPVRTLIGVEDNKPESIAALRAAARGKDMEVVEFPTKYPSGGEKQLIEILTGKQVPSGGLPADIGIVCQNVGTTVAIRNAVMLGRPLLSRITTVTGRAVQNPQNFEVLLGTPMHYLLARAGFDPQKCSRLIMGGPMMGFTVPSAEVPIVKTTNCLLAPTEGELPTPPPAQACIRCGMCAQACPVSLLPQQMFWFARAREFDKIEAHNLFDCIECGACSWVCPSTIPLVQYYRAAKAEIIELRKANEKSEHSRLRFESRERRLEQEAAEKARKRAARMEAAKRRASQSAEDGDAPDDPIQAAIDRAKAKKAAQQQKTGSPNAADDREKLEKTVLNTRKRLATAEEKLAQAIDEGSDLVAALQTGVDKTRLKLAAAEQALRDDQSGASENTSAATTPDAAGAAIAKAVAARARDAQLSPTEKAQQELDKLRLRLDKARARLEQSRSAGEEEKIIIALNATVSRLEEKLATAQSRQQVEEA